MQAVIIKILGTYLNVVNRFSKKIGGKHAFLIFCYPFSVKLKPVQQKFIDTSEQSSYDFNGKKIAVFKWGNGPETILCLHGWQSQSYRWKKYIEKLDKERYTILAVDAPGHGLSEGKILYIPLYAKLLEGLMKTYSPKYILAHSMGAFTSLALFYEKSDLSPQKMALLGTPGEVSEFVEEYSSILGLSDKVVANLQQYFESNLGTTAEYFSAAKFATKQVAEGLIIHDKEDKDAPYNHALNMHKNWSNSKLHTTEGLGHKLRSIEVVEEIVRFFD